MKTLLTATLLVLALSSVTWGQCDYDPYFHNCISSPLSSSHPILDALELTETKVLQTSQTTFTLTTPVDWHRPFDVRKVYIDPKDHPENFVITSSCNFPITVNGYFDVLTCQMYVSWTPTKAGIQKARLYFYALYDDDFSDASHTVLLMGYARRTP